MSNPTKDERCVCGAMIDRQKYTICTKCKRNIVPLVPRHWSETMSADTPLTSKPKLEDFPHPQGGYSTMSFHNALIYWQEREIERLQRDNDRLNDYIKGLPDNESCAHPAMKGTQAYKCELCGQLEERNADETTEPLKAELQRVYGVASHWYEEAKKLETHLARYKQALTRANGFLIMNHLEPVKLEYSSEEPSEQPPVETGLRTGELAQLRRIDAAARFYVDSVKPGTGLAWENLMNALFDGRPEKAK